MQVYVPAVPWVCCPLTKLTPVFGRARKLQWRDLGLNFSEANSVEGMVYGNTLLVHAWDIPSQFRGFDEAASAG